MRGSDFKKRLSLFFCDKVFSIMFFLFIFFFLCSPLSIIVPIKDESRYVMNSNQTGPVGEVYDKQSLEFKFHSTKPDLMGMSFDAATYGRVLTNGILYISVTDEAKNVIFSEEIEGTFIRDNESINITFPMQSRSNNKDYSVNFHTGGIDKSHAITFWANSTSVSGVSTSLNGVQQPTTLLYSLLYIANSFKYTWYLVLLSTFFFVLTIVSYGRNRPKE